jgi:hypothetical protein
MVNRYKPQGRMVEAKDGEFVEFAAFDDLQARYLNVFEAASTYVDLVASGEITAEQAKLALLAIRRLEGF